MAPVLGALADYKGYRNPMFTWSTLLGVFSVIGMMFAETDQWVLLLALYTLSAIGYSASNIFYDSSIMDVTTMIEWIEFPSGLWIWLYWKCISICIIYDDYAIQWIKFKCDRMIGFFITAAWWFIFTVPYWLYVSQKSFIEKPKKSS